MRNVINSLLGPAKYYAEEEVRNYMQHRAEIWMLALTLKYE